jgi:hypothetical protein
MTCPREIALLRYASGEHSEETAGVVEHLASCAPCRAIVQESRRVSAALRSLSAPPAPVWLGHTTTPHRRSWHAVAATFVAGILAGATATYVGESDIALADMASAPVRTVVTATTPHPIGPGRWTYLSREYVDSVLWANPRLSTVTVDSTADMWIIVETAPDGQRDSLRVDRRDLSPISSSSNPLRGHVLGAQRFTRDSMIDSNWTVTRVRRRALAIADSGRLRISDEVMLRLYFRTVSLNRSWRASVRLLDYESPRTADLSVSGRHTITTPVGRCDCWRVIGADRVIWVRADDGVVVRVEHRSTTSDLVAEDPLPN